MVGLSKRIKHRPSEVFGKYLIVFADEPKIGNLDTKTLKDLNNTGVTMAMIPNDA
jgi:predicted ABC-type transport system involved in lysophospholipase L1 biosynthesis ATPase subunit